MRKPLALAFFLLLAPAAPAFSVPQVPASQDEDAQALDELRAAVAGIRTEMLQPGERVEGWNRGGANPDADLRARGADRFYFLTRGRDGTSVGILTDRPISAFAPSEWRVVDSYGSGATALERPQVDFVAFSPRYVMGSRSQFRRVADVDCQDNLAHALLYEVPGAPASPGDDTVPMMFRLMILALEDQEICIRVDGDPERGYRGRFFLPDGRALPAFDDPEALSTIVPAAPVDTLLEPPAPAAEEAPDAPESPPEG